MLVDSHCHLDRVDLRPFDGSFGAMIEDARSSGVRHMLCVCIDLESYPGMLRQVEDYAEISVSVGVHPNDSGVREPTGDDLIEFSSHPKNVAIGETGLDYYRSSGDLDWQRLRFRRHIQVARMCGKPLIIHTRAARRDTIRVMKEENASEVGGVMHCFTEDWEMAKQALDLGFYISFSGIVTFRNATDLRDIARRVPIDRLLVETDAPYLTPVPCRGKPNRPAYVTHVADCVADIRNMSREDLSEATGRNFFDLFSAVQ